MSVPSALSKKAFGGGGGSSRPKLEFTASRHAERDADSRRELMEAIEEYHSETVPLVVSLMLIRQWVRRFDIAYLKGADLSRTASARIDAAQSGVTGEL